MYGKESIYTRLNYPTPNDYVDTSALMLLRETFEVFKRNDVLSDLPDRLRERVAAASKDNKENLLYEQLLLGYLLYRRSHPHERGVSARRRPLPGFGAHRHQLPAADLADRLDDRHLLITSNPVLGFALAARRLVIDGLGLIPVALGT